MAVVVDILYDNTIENSQNNYKIKHPCPNCFFSLEFIMGFFVVFYVITFVLGFLIGDLYFANNHISCQFIKLPIGLTLENWLEVSGYTSMLFVVLVIKCIYLLLCNKEPNFCTISIGFAYSIVSFSWLIIGCFIYWNYIITNNFCDHLLSRYIKLRIWFGLASVFVLVGLCFASWIYCKFTRLY